MPTYYILVDYENVQPTKLELLKDRDFKLLIFVGPQQSKIPVSTAQAIQNLGDRADYVLSETPGKNALDFLIAYCVGKLSATSRQSRFAIVSHDTGFDSLIAFLNAEKLSVARFTSIEDAVRMKNPSQNLPADHVDKVIANLSRRNGSKPKSPKTLRSTVQAMFNKTLSETQLDQLESRLIRRGVLKIEGSQVIYALPETSPSCPSTDASLNGLKKKPH